MDHRVGCTADRDPVVEVYGGSVYAPEILAVAAGHLLNAGLTVALAAAAASTTEHPSTAAILALAVTVGTWIVNFVAAVQGGWWERLAGYTPTSMVAEFQHGLIRMDVVLIASALIGAGLALCAIWMRLGIAVRRRAYESVALIGATAAVVAMSTFATASWDLSENRGNSFPRADEEALERIQAPLKIEVHLAPQDPRRSDLERRALGKLRRVLPRTEVRYVSATSIGLFEQTASQYGEIQYQLNGKREMSRVTTAEGVLEAIYAVAGITPPVEDEDAMFRGHPLAVSPKSAAAIFYGAWPAMVVAGAVLVRRRFA